eukprot:153917_1
MNKINNNATLDASDDKLNNDNNADMTDYYNTRTKELFKEYIVDIDTESTVSSSDIQDDISSIADDEPQTWKRPPRNSAPPHGRPPQLPIPRYSKDTIDMTDYNKYANKSLSRIHRREMTASHVDEISQSEKK